MPFISIIIPTHNNEEHIEQAISSCFDSEFDDIEVIVVNDASTDKTEEKIKNLKEQYPSKLKLITSESQIGPGPARNLGLERACGEYLMFLDGDDWFEHNAIQLVAKKLKEKEPDVLMFNHQRVWSNGITVKNLPNKYVNINYKELDISHPKNRTKIIRNIYSPCNKAYRNSFIKNLGIIFPNGLYEDIHWSINTLINASKAHYISSVIFNYRQRTGSITRTPSIQHTHIIHQYQSVKNLLNNIPDANKIYGKQIYESAKAQIFGVIRVGYRIPKNLEKQFMRDSYQFLKIWKSELKVKKLDFGLIAARLGSRKLFIATQPKIKINNAK